MCRIAGIYNNSKQISDDEISNLKIAGELLKNGGPDNQGIYCTERVALLHRRLSIIDTSESGNQPFFDQTGNYVIIFNGEIFNYEDLKSSKLHHLPITYSSNSDSEILLYLLIHYGTQCLQWLSGFFSFAFYNIQTNELILARDRYGKKPMIIYQDKDTLIFGSELKALFPLIPKKEINPVSVNLYFQYNYLPPTQSILKNVRKLKPGTYLSVKNQAFSEQSFYTLKVRPEAYKQYNYDDACSKLTELMSNAVEERMISDVPLGAFLSGGIDSSTVVALASRFTNQLKTFSIGYKDNPLFDETKYANLVAKKYNTDHQVFYLTENDYKEELTSILDYLDEPFADSSCIPTYILCKKARAFVTVALGGDGGDEVFAGYNRHAAEFFIRRFSLLASAANFSKPLWNMLPQNRNTKVGNYLWQLAKLAEGAKLSKAERQIRWGSILNQQSVQSLFSDEFKATVKLHEVNAINNLYGSILKSDDFNEVLLFEMNLGLPGDMLQKVDMMSMANSLEIRSPFLDSKVVDFAFGLPSNYKIDQSLKKKIVQDAFRSYLPEELYNRPKQGFEIPLLEWFRNDLNDYIFNDLLRKDFVESQGIFSFSEIEKLRRKLHSANPGYVQATIWALIVFQHWYKKYFV